ncbi:replication protein P [Alloalcanivorax sp. C16-1]|uniref:replication protein P n=1 Tax=Alloalcanivorax sp. C16-1 TaxID=3390051 RepID=UPI00397072F7
MRKLHRPQELADLGTTTMASAKPSAMSKTAAGRKGSDELADAVSRVFALFQANWPRRWRSIWRTDEEVRLSKRSWFVAFRDAGLTPRRLAAGLDAVRHLSWPPDNPGAFLELCRVPPESVGAPALEQAWREATSRPPHSDWVPWSHRCVYWAAVRTGRTDLAERGQMMRATFEREYDRTVEEADGLPEPPKGQLPARTSAERRRERERAAAEALPQLKAMVAGW